MKKTLSLLCALSTFVAPLVLGFLAMHCFHDRIAISAIMMLMLSFFSMQGMLERLLTENAKLKDKHEA